MAARHLDEGLLGWLLLAGALAGGLSAIGIASHIGARLGRAVDDNLAHIEK